MRVHNLVVSALLAITLVFIHSRVLAFNFSAPVVSVLDGDTLEVLHNQHPERIRLSGIDCPEKGQAYGNNAKHAASDLAFGKEVTLRTFGKDKYGRTIGDVLLLDGTNVNHTLVKDGCWWWYRKKWNCPEGYHRFNILPDLTENQSASLALTDYTNRAAPELIVAP